MQKLVSSMGFIGSGRVAAALAKGFIDTILVDINSCFFLLQKSLYQVIHI